MLEKAGCLSKRAERALVKMPGEQKLSCAVVVATYNRLPVILDFLYSLRRQTEQPQELIIVDSSDKKLIEEPLFCELFSRVQFPVTQLIYVHTLPGAAYQRNVGADHSTADIIHFPDDDTVLDANYLERMNMMFQRCPEYAGGMGSVKGVAPQKMNRYRLLRMLFFLQRDNARGTFTISGMPTHTYGNSGFAQVEVLGGCCMAYRGAIFKQYKFDESLGRYSYMEDCDLSYRVSRQYPLFFNPEAQLEHHHSPLARDRVEDNRAIFIRNYSYLFFKNFYSRNRFKVVAYWWSVLGLFVEALVIRDKSYLKGYWKGLYRFYFGR